MEKYDFIKCMNIHKRLKEAVKGKVYITMRNNILNINIIGFKGIRYTTNITNLKDRIDYDKIASDILFDYNRFIMNKFFNIQ